MNSRSERGRRKGPHEIKHNAFSLPPGYKQFLEDLKIRIRSLQVRAALSVNRDVVLMYWYIGAEILKRQQIGGWGAKVVERLSIDLTKTFPDMKGFSPRNLKYMRAFAKAYPDRQFVQQVAAQIPWFHHCHLLEKVDDAREREWYIRKTIEHGWSRSILAHQIESGAFKRQGKALSNFDEALLPPQSDLAKQVLKDPYIFDFLSIGDEAVERDLEKALLSHIQEFLLELGVGFAFVGRQYRLSVGSEDFYIDLLFYHLRLRCYVVIELKTADFKPEFAGKMNFYLSAVDDMLRHPEDRSSIGLILCKTANKTVVEYALRDNKKPIGISGYQLRKMLPAELKGNLPSVSDIEAELNEIEKSEK